MNAHIGKLVRDFFWQQGGKFTFTTVSEEIERRMEAEVCRDTECDPEALRVLVAKLRILGVNVIWTKGQR